MTTTASYVLRFSALVAALSAATPAHAAWQRRDLGSLIPSGTPSFLQPRSSGTRVNASGVVAGYSFVPGNDFLTHAVVWPPSGGIVDMTPCSEAGFDFSTVEGLNERGQAVGNDGCGGNMRAFIVTPEDTDGDGRPDRWFRDDDGDGVNDLETLVGPPGCPSSFANAVNQAGQVAGNGCGELFYWDAQGGHRRIGSTPQGGNGIAHINDDGIVASAYVAPDGNPHLFVWTVAGGLTDIGTIPGTRYLQVSGLGDDGTIIGTATLDPGPGWVAFVVVPEDTDGDGKPDLWYRDTSPADGVDDLIAYVGAPGSRTALRAVNDFGVVCGDVPVWAGQAFLWRSGSTSWIPAPTGGTAAPLAINALGEVALDAVDPSGAQSGFVWAQALGAQPLPAPAGSTTSVMDLSASGFATGYVLGPSGEGEAAVWMPDPAVQAAGVAAAVDALESEGALSHGEAQSLARLVTNAGERLAAGNTAGGCALVHAFTTRAQAPSATSGLTAPESRMLVEGVAALCP